MKGLCFLNQLKNYFKMNHPAEVSQTSKNLDQTKQIFYT